MTLTFGELVFTIEPMKTLSLDMNAPICLTLSADARFGGTDYVDDQIWELHWWEREIPSLGLTTSYGRRAQSMLIFPAFSLGGETRRDPKSFHSPPLLRQVLPNIAKLDFDPFRELYVQAEYYVPESHAIAGRYTLHNRSPLPQAVYFWLSAFLQPGEHPNPMGLTKIQGVSTLSGRTADLHPVLSLSGGAEHVSAAYPSLQVAATLAPGGSKTWVWAHAAYKQRQNSFNACRDLFQIPWESTMAQIEIGNARMLSIETGDPDWDAAFWMAQKELLRAFVGPSTHNSRVGLVGHRNTDDGNALTNDGRDHTGQWGGLSTVETCYLASQIIPIEPDFVKDFVRNILRTQNPDGELDWAPGMGGQRAGLQAIPLLSTLAWEIYRWTEDRVFIDEVFPALFSFYDSWFIARHDRDLDGFPEWDHAPHSGLSIRPSFNRFESWAQGFAISHAETVDLAAYLYREGQALISMANVLQRGGITTVIQERMQVLAERVEVSWSERRSSYFHVDRDSHVTHSGLQLAKRRGSFELSIQRVLEPPARLLLRLKGDPSQAKSLRVEIGSQGARKRKRTESLTHRKFQSFWKWGTHTTEKLNYQVEKISVKGIDRNLTMEVVIPDLEREDITLGLPLWAGWMEPSRAKALITNTIMNPDRYLRPNGLSSIPVTDRSYAADDNEGAGAVQMIWNNLLGQGLVEQGFRDEAGQLFQTLMATVLEVLRDDKGFFSAYHSEEVKGIGSKGVFTGVIPIQLFMAVLGVRIISPTKVWIEPGHPFPWPIKIEWQGLSIICEKESVYIRFPDGQQVAIEEGGLQCVEQMVSPPLNPSNKNDE